MITAKQINSISCQDFDRLVRQTYGAIYCFQQQDDCKERGVYNTVVPVAHPEDFERDEISLEVNGSVMGVSFKSWQDAIAKRTDTEKPEQRRTVLLWNRNFYPHVDMVVNDLHARGLLPAGNLQIVIDW